jgi:uncharacterized SAM-binding protein YcdF (DUF218 family)
VPAAAILVEDRSRDTFENQRFAVALLREAVALPWCAARALAWRLGGGASG